MTRFFLVIVTAITLLAQSGAGQNVVGIPYDAQLGSAGDGLFISYTLTSGTLPPGLTFVSDFFGRITGIPTQAGSYPITLMRCASGVSQGCASEQRTITIRNPCASLSKNSAAFTAAGGSGDVNVVAPAICDWQVTGDSSLPFWVHLTYTTLRGSTTVHYAVDPTTYSRSATFVIGDTPFTVQEDASSAGLMFFPVTPCRVADTRDPANGPAIAAGATRNFSVIAGNNCGVAFDAQVYSLNVTAVPSSPLGYLTIWPTDAPQPSTSTLNSLSGNIVANAAIVPAGTAGRVSVFVTNTTDVVLDINGYFAPQNGAAGLAFFPIPPCRAVDTRNAAGPLGGPALLPMAMRSFQISSTCGLPAQARAYSLNATVVPSGPLGYLTLWPSDQMQPFVSTLNSLDGSIVANGAIVPASADGSVSAFATNATDLVLDINGYFAPPAAGGLAFFPVTPCRVLDTRNAAGPFGAPSMVAGTVRPVPLPFTSCGVPASAQAYALNATVVPSAPLGYLTLWPAGSQQPFVSTLNSLQGAITANAAIVPATPYGISAFATGPTDLVLDVTGYFAPLNP